MERKKLITLGMIVGGFLGGYIPSLWDAGAFSFSGLLFSAAGSVVGILLGFRFGE